MNTITAAAHRPTGGGSQLGRRAAPRGHSVRRCASAAVALAVAAALLVVVPAPVAVSAQSGALVSNIDQAISSNWNVANQDVAAEFTTGSHAAGYTLSDIEIRFGPTDPAALSVKLATGLPDATTVVATLANPATVSADAVNTFTAPDDTTLSPATTYYVVVEGAAGSPRGTVSDAEDSGTVPGWSVGNSAYFRSAASTGPWTADSSTLSIRVNGLPAPTETEIAPEEADEPDPSTAAQNTAPSLPTGCASEDSNPQDWIAAVSSTATTITVTWEGTLPASGAAVEVQLCGPDGATPSRSNDYRRTLSMSVTAGGTTTITAADPFEDIMVIAPDTDYWIRVWDQYTAAERSSWHYIRTKSVQSAADDHVLVSNMLGAVGQIAFSKQDHFIATSFTTGASDDGWTLTGAVVRFQVNSATASTAVKIRNDNAGAPGSTVVATLTGSINAAEGDYTFTAPEGTVLTGGTTYWLVVNDGIADTRAKPSLTSSTTDVPRLSGWSIADDAVTRAMESDSWAGGNNRVLFFTLKGFKGLAPVPSVPLVSNVGQPQQANINLGLSDGAGVFTTGSNEFGYTLSDIEVRLLTVASSGATVKLATGLPSATNVVATLTAPGSFAANALNKFTAPAGTTLAAGTTYYVVIEGFSGETTLLGLTGSHGEDSGAVAGWSIGNSRHHRVMASNGAWSTTNNPPLFRVNGSLKTTHDAPGKPAVPTVVATSPVSLKVSWAEPSHAGPSGTIDDYDVRWYQGTADPTTEADWVEEGETNGPPDPGTATSVEITGLTANKPYRVQVRAHDTAEGPWSDSASATTQAALANPVVLVSNIGQTDSGTIHCNLANVNCAQPFRTGAAADGYTVGTVDLDFTDAPSGVTVKLAAVLSTPGVFTEIATLANPATLAAGNNVFTAPAGTNLSANSAYWVQVTGTGGNLSVKTATAEDAGGQAGWSVDDNRQTGTASPSAVSSWSAPGASAAGPLGIRVNGAERDVTPPRLESAVVVGDTMTLTFSEALTGDAPHPTHLSVKVDGAVANPIAVAPSADFTQMGISLLSAVTAAQVVTVGYIPPADSQLRDASGNLLAGFSDAAVTNNTPPVVSRVDLTSDPGSDGVYGLGDNIDVSVTFDVNVAVTSTPRLKIMFDPLFGDKWADYHSGSGTKTLVFRYGPVVALNVSRVGVAVLEDTLELNGGTIKGATSEVDAVLDHDGIAHNAGHRVDGVAPTLTEAVVEGSTAALVYSEDLDTGSVPHMVQFPFRDGSSTRAITGVRVVGNRVELTLVGAPSASGALTVQYNYDSSFMQQRPIQDVAGNDAATFSTGATVRRVSSPEFTAGATATLSIDENNADAASVGTVAATDTDGDTLKYFLGGADAASFTIDSSTGEIKVASGVTLNREAKASYAVTAHVSDGEVWGQTAAASPATVVSNTGRPKDSVIQGFGLFGGIEFQSAQAFTTGDHGTGYTLSAIGLHITQWNGNLANASASVWSTTADGLPDSLLYTLTKPATAVDAAVNTFTAPAGATLSPNTAYALVLGGSSGSVTQASLASDAAEDGGAASGWSIADNRSNRQINSGTPSSWLAPASDKPFQISVDASLNDLDDSIAVTVDVGNVLEPPTAKPTGLTATTTSRTMTLSWTAVAAAAGGPAVNDYDVRYFQGSADPTTEADWIEPGETGGHTHTGGPATTSTIMGLEPGTAYRAQVRANSADGAGPWSDSVGGMTGTLPSITLTMTKTGGPPHDEVTEGTNGLFSFSATRPDESKANALTVRYTVQSASTATASGDGDDYNLTRLPVITFAAGSTAGTASGMMTFETIDDMSVEGDETVVLGATAPGFDVVPVTITIKDNDVPSDTVTLTVSPTAVAEAAASAVPVTVTATLNAAVRSDNVTVSLALSGTAAKGAAIDASRDYTDPGTLPTITITAGQTFGTATVSIDPNNDSLYEGDETIIVTPSTSATGISTLRPATITIDDDETKPTTINLSFTPTEINEGAGSAVTVTQVTATLAGSATLPGATVVSLASALGGTAVAGPTTDASRDYTLSGALPASPTVTIPAGSSSGTLTTTFTIAPNDDNASEGDETITLGGSACLITPAMGAACPAADTLTVNDAVLTLVDNDLPVITLSVERVSPSVGPDNALDEGATVRFRVTATREASDSTKGVTVTLAAQDTSTAVSGAGNDYTASFGSLRLAAGSNTAIRRLDVTALEDVFDDGDKTIVVGGTATGFAVRPVTVTIKDNDDPTDEIALSLNRLSMGEGSGSRTVRVTATVNKAAPTTDVTIDLELDGTAVGGGTDYTATIATPQTIVIAAGQRSGFKDVAIDPVQDTIHEGLETIVFKDADGTSAGGWVVPVTPPEVAFTIQDDDAAPTAINLSFTPSSIAEDHGSAVTVTKVTATLVGSSTLPGDTVVTLGSSLGGTATGGGTDYAADVSGAKALPGTVTIPAGMSSGEVTTTFTITPTDNDVSSAADKTITLAGSACKTALLGGSCPTSPTDQRYTVNDAVLTLVDDDLPVISLSTTRGGDSDPNDRLDEGDDETFTVTATRGVGGGTARLSVPVRVDASSSATSGTDYTALANPAATITIPANRNTATATVRIRTTEDRLIEGNETIVLTTAVTGFNVDPATITIVDDDNTSDTITLAVNPANVSEGAGSRTVRVTAKANDGAPTADVPVTLTITGTAEAGSGKDYTANPATLPTVTITAGQTEASTTVSIALNDDTLDEGPDTSGGETIIITPATTATGFNTLNAATLTITDNDPTPTTINLSFVPAEIGEDDSSTPVKVKATLSGASTRTVPTVVTLGTALAGTAVGGPTTNADRDYTTPSSLPTSVTIPAGMSSAESAPFDIAPHQNSDSEPDKTITLGGSLASFTVTDATLTLEDDENPVIALSAQVKDSSGNSVTEGNAATFTITASRTLGVFTDEVTVQLALQTSSSATSGDDYTELTNLPSVTIPANATSATAEVTVTTLEDRLVEGGETVVLGASLEGFTVTPATIAIADDDNVSDAITLTIDTTEIDEGSASTVKITGEVNDGAPAADVSIVLTLSGTARRGAVSDDTRDYSSPANVTLTIPANEVEGEAEITFTPFDDSIDEDDETIIISAGGSFGGLTIASTPGSFTINLTDNDTVSDTIALSGSPAEIDEDTTAAETTVTVTATLGTAVTRTVPTVVSLDSALAGSATLGAGKDYALKTGSTLPSTVTIPAGMRSGTATFIVTVNNDSISEGDETITLGGSACKVALVGGSCPTSPDDERFTVSGLSITLDDDDAPEITLSTALVDTVANPAPAGATATSVAEGTAATFTVTARRNTADNSGAVTVQLEIEVPELLCADCANSGADYNPPSTLPSITIPDGDASATAEVTIATRQDRLVDPNERIVFDADVTTAGAVFSVNETTITITDDDMASTEITLRLKGTPSLAENGEPLRVTVEAELNDGAAINNIALDLSFEGSAVKGAESDDSRDYSAPDGLVILINHTELLSETAFTITPHNDDIDEDDETITVTGIATGFTVHPVSLSIADDDTASRVIHLSAEPASIDEDDEDQTDDTQSQAAATPVTITATLDGSAVRGTATTVTLDSTLGGTAGSGDYTSTGLPGAVTIPAGSSSGSVTGWMVTPTLDETA